MKGSERQTGRQVRVYLNFVRQHLDYVVVQHGDGTPKRRKRARPNGEKDKKLQHAQNEKDQGGDAAHNKSERKNKSEN